MRSVGGNLRVASARVSAVIGAAGRARQWLCIAVLVGAPPAIFAQSGAGYDLHWNALPSGGGAMTGANGYTVTGAIAPTNAPAAGAAGYVLRAGFWSGVHENDVVFRNGFQTLP